MYFRNFHFFIVKKLASNVTKFLRHVSQFVDQLQNTSNYNPFEILISGSDQIQKTEQLKLANLRTCGDTPMKW